MKTLFKKKPSEVATSGASARPRAAVCKLGSKRACYRSVHPRTLMREDGPTPPSCGFRIRKTKTNKPNTIPPDAVPSVLRASARRLRSCLRGQHPASQRTPSMMNGPIIPSETSGIKQKWNTKKSLTRFRLRPENPMQGEAPCCVRRERKHDSRHSYKRFKEKGTHNIR